MENFILVTVCLLIGFGLKHLCLFPAQTGNVLNLTVIYVSLPALVLLQIPQIQFSKNLLVPVIMPWILLFVTAGIILLLAKKLHWDRATAGCLLLLVPLGNASFLDIPMVQAFFGEQAVSYALLCDQLGSFPALALYGSLILALYAEDGQRPNFYGIVKKVATFPPFVAPCAALILKNFSYPPVAVSVSQMLAAALVPSVMIAAGFQLTFRLERRVTGQLSIGLFLKLAAAPPDRIYFV